ncbi:MAG: endo-1,4-beta-xylanase [Lentimonas sp.]
MRHIIFWALALFITSSSSAIAQERSAIRLAEINGRTWLINPEGNPFFAHGITHMSNQKLSKDYKAVSKACKDLGFNAYGYGCPTELKSDMPYLDGRNYVPISVYRSKGGSFRFIDIFDPREQQKMAEQVRQTCLQNRDNPNLIGYCWTDLGAWPLKNSTGSNWVDFTRDLPTDAPGRKVYAKFLKTWKGDDEKARDLAFLRLIAREYFRVMGEANRKHDPNHLLFGDRFAFDTIVPEVLEEITPWVDAIAIQPPFHPGFPKAKFQAIHELTGKPILICDFAIRFKDGDKKIRGWKLQENDRVAGERYIEYVRAALETPYIIGAFWCNPIDSTPTFNKGSGIKQGMFDDGLTQRPGLSEAIIELNRHIAQVTPDGADAPKAPEARLDKRLRDIIEEKFPKGNVYIGATTTSPKGPLGQTLAQEFSYITPANDFKQTQIHPEPGQWRWEKPDRWVDFAEEHNQVIRLHGPISPQCSRWAKADHRTAEELEQNLKAFMSALCKRYNGNKNILWMDVVNETVNPDGAWKKAKPGAKWEMPWEKIGYEKTPAEFKHLDGQIPKYIIQAFRIATEHAPNIKLVINQHLGMEEAAWNKVKAMVLYLRSIGCRVDGIGWQAHIKLIKDDPSQWETGTINTQDLSDLIAWAHAHDLEFHITENNLHVRPEDEENVDEHTAVFAGIFKALLENRHTGVVTWNLWDIKDVQHYAIENVVKIGLWDRNLRPKEAYYALQQLLENPPPARKR